MKKGTSNIMKQHDTTSDGPPSHRTHQVSAKGALALITGPLRNVPPSKDYSLEYYDHDTNMNLDEETCLPDVKGVDSTAMRFNPDGAEFTLLFFCDFETCRNSKRIAPIVGHFMNGVKSLEDGNEQITISPKKNPVHLICIPNDELRGKVFKEMSQLTDYSCLGFNHSNRLHLIRMLSVSAVPTIIVINNQTGKVVTTWGIEVIENQNDPKYVLNEWRVGRSAVPLHVRVISACSIS